MTRLFARLKEPSTYAGLAILAGFARHIWPNYGPILDAAAAALAGGAVAVPERGRD
jgi:hypothetical protein